MDLQVGVKILLKNKEGKYLVVCRSAEKYPEAGAQWEIVGGRIDPGTSLFENLKREVMEETGLHIEDEIKLIAAQDILKTQKHIVRLTYIGEGDGEVKLSDEHTDFKWVTLGEILKLEPLDTYLKEVLEDLK
ncbi:NUDIX domain-containing protein [Patescibacteria group bacterium]|nr:NUDIX domain-containing protein [Patescibacteria group bacterium]